MASISSGSGASFTQQQGAAAVRNYRRRQNEIDARMTAQQNQNRRQEDYEEQQRLIYQRQMEEEEYNRSIASPGHSSSSRMSRHQLVQRRLERRRQERRLRTNDLQTSQTTSSQPMMHQPPPPPGTSPRSIMKKSSSYQTMPDQQQYFHNQQRQPQHTNTSSNYSSDSSGNYISPPILNRKQPFPDEPSHSNSQNNHNVFTQNGVVIDRTAFRPTRNRLRLPHESPSDEWSRNGSPANHNRVQRGQYQQQQQHQYQQHPQIYVPDTPSQNSGSYDHQSQRRGNNREPNWQQLDQQRLMYQKQEATRHRGHMEQQQQNVSYVSDDEDNYKNGHVNTSFNSQANTVKTQNRSRSLSKERQLPRRWRHNRTAASVGRGGMSQASVSTPLSAEDSAQFQYTPRSRLAVTESLGQSEVNTSMSSHHSLGARSNPNQNGHHGRRQQNFQHQQNQRHPPASEHEWRAQDNRHSHHTHQNVVSPARSEESVSVASIRKSWEGRVEHQRGRSQDTRNTGENQYDEWEGRGRDNNRVSQMRQGEQRQRREQTRNIDNKWKRNSSLPPPERRRGGGMRHEEYSDVDGYQSDGGYRSQPERIEVDAASVTIHDARRRLWDQDERLRAVLPQAESFDSYGDVRNRRPLPTVGLASPGNVSTLSTGSALFKSKFVHAAALAAQKRDIPVDGGHHHSFHYPNKAEDESPKGSSQITDSTADTTAPSSNHTSHGENARKQPSQPAATMPSIAEARPIAEAPQASVADLIARINAVSRDNPAEALARIDSIIKGESAGDVKPRQKDSGVSNLFNFDAAKKQSATSKRPIKGNVTNDPPAVPHVEKRFAFEGDDPEDEDDDPSVDDSLLSGESTVSSMTNPTYQSVHETRRSKSSKKHADSERQPPSPQIVTTRSKGAEKHMPTNKQEHGASRGGDDGPLTKAKLKSFDNDNDWTTSAPQSDFFTEFGGFRNASTQAVSSSRTMQIKKSTTSHVQKESTTAHAQKESTTSHHEQKVPVRPATPDIMNAVSSAFSDVNISFGDTNATQDLLAKAFSDLDEKGKSQKSKAHNQNVMTNAFSDVDISMEQKTVKQRRKELELLSKSMTGASEDAGDMNQINSSAFDWDIDEPAPTKQKKKTEPTLRLKSNKKLTQKFANLVKAFENF